MPDSWWSRFAALFTFYGIALLALVALCLALIYAAPAGLVVNWWVLVATTLLGLAGIGLGVFCRRKARSAGWPS